MTSYFFRRCFSFFFASSALRSATPYAGPTTSPWCRSQRDVPIIAFRQLPPTFVRTPHLDCISVLDKPLTLPRGPLKLVYQSTATHQTASKEENTFRCSDTHRGAHTTPASLFMTLIMALTRKKAARVSLLRPSHVYEELKSSSRIAAARRTRLRRGLQHPQGPRMLQFYTQVRQVRHWQISHL